MFLLAGIDNERIREILPLLRPRSPEPTLFSQTVFYLLWAGLALLVFLYFLRKYRVHRRRSLEFRELGFELGMNESQIELLKKISKREKMKNPQRLLTSATFFDRHVGEFAGRFADRDLDHPVLAEIAQIRTVLRFDELPAAKALSSTRQVDKGQTILVWQEGDVVEGFSPWLVVDRSEGALSVVPLLKGDKGYFADMKVEDTVSVRFWRDGDTEYRFDTEVVDVDEDGAFLLRHTTEVERLQQRDFFRVNVDFDLTLYALAEDDGVDGGESGAGDQDGDRDAPVEEAAIVLLDRNGIDEPDPDLMGDEPTTVHDIPALREEEDDESASLDLESAPRLDTRAINISAGGMSIVAGDELPPAKTWLVDPTFDGSFPLASVVCRVMGENRSGGRVTVKLKFEDLPHQIEGEIVKKVYQHQIIAAGGTLLGSNMGEPEVEVRPAGE